MVRRSLTCLVGEFLLSQSLDLPYLDVGCFGDFYDSICGELRFSVHKCFSMLFFKEVLMLRFHDVWLYIYIQRRTSYSADNGNIKREVVNLRNIKT